MMAWVSVILTTQGDCTGIKDAIDSVNRQTTKFWELIIVSNINNKIIAPYLWSVACNWKSNLNTNHGLVVRYTAETDITPMRNCGRELALGQAVCYLDTCNKYKPDYILTMWNNLMGNSNVDYVCCNVDVNGSKSINDCCIMHRVEVDPPDFSCDGDIKMGFINRTLVDYIGVTHVSGHGKND